MDVRVLPDHRDGELSGSLLPLTGAQANVWYHQQLDPGSVAYNIGQYIEIDGVIEPERMARALQSVVDSMEAYRVRFVVREIISSFSVPTASSMSEAFSSVNSACTCPGPFSMAPSSQTP